MEGGGERRRGEVKEKKNLKGAWASMSMSMSRVTGMYAWPEGHIGNPFIFMKRRG